ncbi:MAG: hypothetical protein GWP21_05810 [Euryarchaeota archaeon]|nr:hypothetical protein [Euryarchaeota archaeon]
MIVAVVVVQLIRTKTSVVIFDEEDDESEYEDEQEFEDNLDDDFFDGL